MYLHLRCELSVVCDVLYAVLYVRVSCSVVRGCAVSRRYIDVCNCDVFSVVNVYLDHFKFCVVCVFIVEGMWDVLNVMFSLMSVMGPPPTTQPTSGGTVTAVTNCCANCVEPSFPQQWWPDLPFLGKPAMRTRWMAGAAPHKSW